MQNKLIVSHGDATVMGNKAKIICDDIFVDALTLVVIRQYGCLELLKKMPRIHVCYATVSKLQEYYPTFDFVYVKEVLSWLQTADNIIWEPRGFSFETELSKVFSNEYLVCCSSAARINIPLLTIEPNFEVLATDSEVSAFKGLQTVGVVSLCYSFIDKAPLEAHQGLFNLLEYCSFVNFNSDTIITQIEKDGDHVVTESLSRFFFCNTSCDMMSFAHVYLETVTKLVAKGKDVAIGFAEMLLNDAERIWRRGSHYRYCIEKYEDKESEMKVEATVQYLAFLLIGLKEIFNEIPDQIKLLYEKVSMHLTKNFGKDFIDKIRAAVWHNLKI